MAYENSVAFSGNATRDPELRESDEGVARARLGVAVHHRRQDEEEETSFFDVIAFGHLARKVASELAKGERVIVVGRLSQRRWTTPEGDNRQSVEVIAEDVGKSILFAGESPDAAASGPEPDLDF